MFARRWSPFWAFGAGCLSSAVLIGWRLADVGVAPPNTSPATLTGGSSERRARALDPLPTHEVQKPASAERTDVEAKNEAPGESGESVAEVLARLEGEYRQRTAPAPTAQPSAVPSAVQALPELAHTDTVAKAIASESPTAAKLPTTEQTALASLPRVPPAPATTSATPAPVAAIPVEEQPTLPAPEEVASLVASMHEVQDSAVVESGQQRITEQLQQVTALQRAALLQQAALAQQFALLQYLQLFSLSSAPRGAVPAPAPRRSSAARMVDTLPSSISATDNPWGFKLQPSILVR